MTQGFLGLGLHLGNLSRLSTARSRSISAENPTGEKGKGGMAEDGTGAIHARGLGRGWNIASVAYWRQTLPTALFPALPDRDNMEIV